MRGCMQTSACTRGSGWLAAWLCANSHTRIARRRVSMGIGERLLRGWTLMAECCPRQIFANVSALVRILYQAPRELTFVDLCLAACTRRS